MSYLLAHEATFSVNSKMAGFNMIMSKSREKDKPELSRAGCVPSGSPPGFSPPPETFVSTPTLRLPSRFFGVFQLIV